MIRNINYRLKCVQKELEKQEREYLQAIIWGMSTKAITFRILQLKAEEEILAGLLQKYKGIPPGTKGL